MKLCAKRNSSEPGEDLVVCHAGVVGNKNHIILQKRANISPSI